MTDKYNTQILTIKKQHTTKYASKTCRDNELETLERFRPPRTRENINLI